PRHRARSTHDLRDDDARQFVSGIGRCRASVQGDIGQGMTMRWFGANNDHATRLAFLLHFSAFLSGFVTMALEMLIGRTCIPYFGGTIYTWGALISVFLTGMTLGYMIGGKAADRWPAIPIVAALFVAAAATVVIVPPSVEYAINRIL